MKTKHHPRDIRICPGKRQWFRSPSLSFLVSSSRRTKDPSQYSNNTIRFRYYSISSKQITRQDRFATVNTRQNTLLHRHPAIHSSRLSLFVRRCLLWLWISTCLLIYLAHRGQHNRLADYYIKRRHSSHDLAVKVSLSSPASTFAFIVLFTSITRSLSASPADNTNFLFPGTRTGHRRESFIPLRRYVIRASGERGSPKVPLDLYLKTRSTR